jgi:hypothetical protein
MVVGRAALADRAAPGVWRSTGQSSTAATAQEVAAATGNPQVRRRTGALTSERRRRGAWRDRISLLAAR